MAEQASAHPQGTFVRAQTPAVGISDLISTSLPHISMRRALKAAAAVHLVALAAFELIPGGQPVPILLILTGLVLTLIAIQVHQPVAVAPSPAAPRFDGNATPAHATREFMLECQSQRLVEIADAAGRARRDAERRSQAWATLMAQVSHDLRTPLNAVIGFSDVMNAEMFGPMGHPRYREYVDHIRDSGRALLKSAEDTLALTSLLANPGSAILPTALDIGHIARDAWGAHAATIAGRNLSLAIEAEDDLQLLGDRRLIRQVLINLFCEAIARAGHGAHVVLSAHAAGELVDLEIVVRGAVAKPVAGEASLSICLARALLELQDADLIELPPTSGEWRAITMLARASQTDFFAIPTEAGLPQAYAC